MPTKEGFIKALEEVRKSESEKHKKTGFVQSVDLIINLREFDIKKTPINIFINVPHQTKEKKVAAFFEKKSSFIDTITKLEFDDFKDKKKLKLLVRSYDFFIANAKLMPAVATTFGRVLGPASKMPTPQMGIVVNEDEPSIKSVVAKINAVVRARTKEPTIKVSIGKQTDKDSDLADNALAIYNDVYKVLPRQKENLKNILVKFTMSKPAKVAI